MSSLHAKVGGGKKGVNVHLLSMSQHASFDIHDIDVYHIYMCMHKAQMWALLSKFDHDTHYSW